MPSIIGDYNITTREDAHTYISNTIAELNRCATINDRYTYALIAFTVCDTYFHWLIDKYHVLANIRQELSAFRGTNTAREMKLYADFKHLYNRIGSVLASLHINPSVAVPPRRSVLSRPGTTRSALVANHPDTPRPSPIVNHPDTPRHSPIVNHPDTPRPASPVLARPVRHVHAVRPSTASQVPGIRLSSPSQRVPRHHPTELK